MEFVCKIAGLTVAIRAQYESTRQYCASYLCDGKPDFSVAVTDDDIAYEREKCARDDYLMGYPSRVRSDAYLETVAVQRKLAERLFAYDTILFHGSVVAVNGIAYLFTAKSGTGKSTHTKLWREVFGDRATMVNDDKPFLKVTDNGILAYGSPWNGKHGLGTNTAVPLRAICILERGEENYIRQITAKKAVYMLLQQSNRPVDGILMPKYMELVGRLADNLFFYCLTCNMETEAATVAYEAMSPKQSIQRETVASRNENLF